MPTKQNCVKIKSLRVAHFCTNSSYYLSGNYIPMPGSIHISVLDFSELPSSSPSSSILLKASMGKSDHQTWGKGDFSLPLKTLRDNVNITLLDSEGNELSHAGVRIKSIVEKGSLDESISLEGGGIVNLKLQFVLNEEDRNKIRTMRESAMKRKRDELLTISTRYPKIAGTDLGTVTPTSRANHEVSDSRAIVSQNEVSGVGDQAIQSREGYEAHTKAIIPNEANGSDASKGDQFVNHENQKRPDQKIETGEENCSRLVDNNGKQMDQIVVPIASLIKDDSLDMKIETSAEIHEGLVEKHAKQMPQNDAPKIPITSKDASSFPKDDLDTREVNKVEEALEKTRSNDRIYESEDASSVFSIPREARVGDENLNKTNEKIKNNGENQNRLEEKNEIKLDKINFPKRPISSDDASKDVAAFDVKKHGAVQIETREPLQKTSSNEMRPVIKPPPIKTQPDKVVLEAPKGLDSKDNTKPTKLHSSKVKMLSLQDEKKSKPVETDGKKTEERIGNDSSRYATRLEEPSALQTQVKKTEAITNMTDSCEHEFSSTETSGVWIFPDEETRVCVTTEIKQVNDSEGNYSIDEQLSPRFSLSETVEKDIRKSGIYPDVSKSERIKSSNESSPQTETSPGPFGQAIKIAIMVAFGSLVLLTRQRMPR